MSYEEKKTWTRHTWSPQDSEGVDHYTLSQYLQETMGEAWGSWWMKKLDRLARGGAGAKNADRLVQEICTHDGSTLVELLYPEVPDLFLTPQPHPQLWKGELNALARCAQAGSVACLETLLELGADPNGLDCPTGWNTLPDPRNRSRKICVTPLDCALAEGQEECAFLLEQYGGETARKLCGLGEDEDPQLIFLWERIFWKGVESL